MNSFDAAIHQYLTERHLTPSEVEEMDAMRAEVFDTQHLPPFPVDDEIDVAYWTGTELDEDGYPLLPAPEYDGDDYGYVSDDDMEWFLDRREDRDVWG